MSIMGSVSDNPVVQLNTVLKTKHHETSSITNVSGFPAIPARRAFESLKRMQADYFPPRTLGEEALMMAESVLANPVEVPTETNNQTANAYTSPLEAARRAIASWLTRFRTDYFPPGRFREECEMMPVSVSANPLVQPNVVEELPVDTNNQTANANTSALIAVRQPFSHIKRLWAGYFPQGRLGEECEMMPVSVSANPVVEPNIVEELPAIFPVIAARRLIAFLKRLWTHYWKEEGVMSPKLAFKVVILGLFGFAEIRFQGGTGSPFQTHPRISMVSVTSMIMYGLLSYVLLAARPGPNSV